ncbi:NAD-dependent epimerase/dehydratase family protein [Fictibacillus iocasae]|uniref:NAD-dependent epimerase/dehydratase family protein n=1 Tax=Fictibacillus iocasae TaxID=2715437 RepID=A0ABW2NLW8_9BACL
MEVLLIGGTRFLGRHITESLLKNGHRVTLFNRGQFASDLFPECEKITGDRTTDFALLTGRSFDAVIDTCGYLPDDVRKMARTLHPVTPMYVFISSISVYADLSQEKINENCTVSSWEHIDTNVMDWNHYGPLKAACEQAVIDEYGSDASLIIRPGLIVGPHDYSDRFTYWIERILRGGKVLAPVSPQERTQFIDVRDLAEWIVAMTETNTIGTFQAAGTERTLGELFTACQAIAQSDAEFVWADEHFLKENEVGEWVELPLWIASPQYKGMACADDSKAQKHGLQYRPIIQTIRDTLSWSQSRSLAPDDWRAGLSPEKEISVLHTWHSSFHSNEK